MVPITNIMKQFKLREYRFRINDIERIMIIYALKTQLNSFKKIKEFCQDKPLEFLKKFYNINSNEITKEHILEVHDLSIQLISNLISKFENPKRGRKRYMMAVSGSSYEEFLSRNKTCH
jgi:hypothetical protein